MSQMIEIPRDALTARVRGHATWEARVAAAFDPASENQAHLAVMRQPYISYVLAREKSIESRFSRVQAPPYGRVRRGDLLLLKAVGGPVTALAVVASADFYVLDTPTFEHLRERFAAALCASDPEFWDERRDARFATLMRLGEVLPIDPLAVGKRDRRGWVVLGRGGLHRGQLGLDLVDPRPARQRLLAEDPGDDDGAAPPPAAQLQFALEG